MELSQPLRAYCLASLGEATCEEVAHKGLTQSVAAKYHVSMSSKVCTKPLGVPSAKTGDGNVSSWMVSLWPDLTAQRQDEVHLARKGFAVSLLADRYKHKSTVEQAEWVLRVLTPGCMGAGGPKLGVGDMGAALSQNVRQNRQAWQMQQCARLLTSSVVNLLHRGCL
ncbi:hypothetical protein WJX82_005618 [Trebouxia sp. C0006]